MTINYLDEDAGDRVQHLDTTAMDGQAGTIRAVDDAEGDVFVRFDHGHGGWYPLEELVVYSADDENDGLTDEDLAKWHAELVERFHRLPVEPGRTVVRGISEDFHGLVHRVSDDGQWLYVVVYETDHIHGWHHVLDVVRVVTAGDVDVEWGTTRVQHIDPALAEAGHVGVVVSHRLSDDDVLQVELTDGEIRFYEAHLLEVVAA